MSSFLEFFSEMFQFVINHLISSFNPFRKSSPTPASTKSVTAENGLSEGTESVIATVPKYREDNDTIFSSTDKDTLLTDSSQSSL